MRRLRVGVLLLAAAASHCGWTASAALAQDNPATAAMHNAAMTVEIRSTAAAYVKTLQGGNAAEIAAFWTDDGEYVDATGARHKAREIVQTEFAGSPADAASSEGALAAPSDTTITFVGPTVAVEESRDVAQRAGATGFLAVWVKQDSHWRLRLLRETAGAAAPSAVPNGLSELAWLVGRWSSSDAGADVELTTTQEDAYLMQRFVVRRDGQTVREGTQRIAWDAAAGRPRSWTFHADGGFSAAAWQKEGDVWVVNAAGQQADGRRTKSVQFWTREGDDGCWFKSLQGEIDGKPAADLVLKFARVR